MYHCDRKMVTSGAKNTFSSHPGVAGEVDQEAWENPVSWRSRWDRKLQALQVTICSGQLPQVSSGQEGVFHSVRGNPLPATRWEPATHLGRDANPCRGPARRKDHWWKTRRQLVYITTTTPIGELLSIWWEMMNTWRDIQKKTVNYSHMWSHNWALLANRRKTFATFPRKLYSKSFTRWTSSFFSEKTWWRSLVFTGIIRTAVNFIKFSCC